MKYSQGQYLLILDTKPDKLAENLEVSTLMSDEKFAQLLVLNSELRSVEDKGPGAITDMSLVWRVIRASPGLSNIRGGRYIIIGIEEDKANHKLNLEGLTKGQAKSWSIDALGYQIALYADVYVSFLPPETVTHQGRQGPYTCLT